MAGMEFGREQGLELLDRLREQGTEVRSVVVRQHGREVFSHAAAPFVLDAAHPLYSVTKSFTSMAVGLCIEKGLFDLEDTWIRFFPEYVDAVADPRFCQVTVRNLLTMNLGQDAEPLVTGSDDWACAVVAKPLTFEPGTVFHYNSMCSHLLSMLVQRTSGHTEEDLLALRLFGPLGIKRWWWEKDAAGHSTGGFGLHLATPDLARFGQCVLDGGTWEGQQVLPVAWVTEATRKQVETQPFYPNDATENRNGYGYQFWMCAGGGYRCSGLWGQVCYMRPQDDLVMAVSSSTTGSKPIMAALYPVIGAEVPGGCADAGKDDTSSVTGGHDTLLTVAGQMTSPVESRALGHHELLHNAGGFDAMDLQRHGSALQVTLVRAGERFTVEADHEAWLQSDVHGAQNLGALFPFATDSAEKDVAPAWKVPTTFGCYAWITPTTLELQTRELDSTRRVTMRLVVDGLHMVAQLDCQGMLCGLEPTSYLMAT